MVLEKRKSFMQKSGTRRSFCTLRPRLLHVVLDVFLIVCWYVSNVSIIFDAPCLFLHHLHIVSLHLVAFLWIFRN
jgi:hypothetical protein